MGGANGFVLGKEMCVAGALGGPVLGRLPPRGLPGSQLATPSSRTAGVEGSPSLLPPPPCSRALLKPWGEALVPESARPACCVCSTKWILAFHVNCGRRAAGPLPFLVLLSRPLKRETLDGLTSRALLGQMSDSIFTLLPLAHLKYFDLDFEVAFYFLIPYRADVATGVVG